MLCEYAKAADGQVDIMGGGVQVMPADDAAWYLAGTVDVDVRVLANGFDVWVVEMGSEEEVPGSRQHLSLEPIPEAGDGIVRLPLALKLPVFDLAPGRLHMLCLTWGDVINEQLPFYVREVGRTDEPLPLDEDGEAGEMSQDQ